ncbi:MAG: hypothetical protein SFX18_17795 [Pirellulales bacterium]|nr:hypothetical protein [Pirellulales bacterium]
MADTHDQHARESVSQEIDHLLRNAELRNQLEPYLDDSISWINREQVPTPLENEFLESMLAWERAPIVPIAQWYSPPLELPPPEALDDATLHERLWQTIHQLFSKRIVLDFTDHLSDRELYCVIYRDILPSEEKKLDGHGSYLHWDCSDMGDSAETWLTYYASEEDRRRWAEEFGDELPPVAIPPHPRDLPHEPYA